MASLFVLVHSPSVGPATWTPIAAELTHRGHSVLVPSLLGVADQPPPAWRQVTAAVTDALAAVPADRPLILVGHSNAGAFLPSIGAAVRQPVETTVFVDALVPPAEGAVAIAEGEFLDFLRGLAGPDGRLPRWTDWWDPAEVAPMFPSAEVRDVVSAEQPQLPLSYYEQVVPVPDGWTARRCAYLLFGPPYEDMAARARTYGWPVAHVPGEHLHQLVDPVAVTDALLAVVARIPRVDPGLSANRSAGASRPLG